MKKRIVTLFFICAAFIALAVGASAQSLLLEYDGGVHEYTGSIYKLKVNDRSVKTPLEPIIFNDRALVPIREVFEAMGANVAYTDATKRIDVTMGGTSVTMNIDSNTAYINGQATAIPDNITPKLIAKVGESAKTMVPVRFISESIGMNVDFDGNQGIIDIKSQENKNNLIDISYQMKSNTEIVVTAKTEAEIAAYSDFTMTDPDRVVVDIASCALAATSKLDVNQGAVSAVRLGDDGNRTRIVIDTQSIQSYHVDLSAGKNILTITLVTGAVQQPAPSAKPEEPKPSNPTNSNIIVLDAGHGGKDGGAGGNYQGADVYEKDLTLAITKKVQAILTNNGYTVKMTRDGDTYPELTERSDLANNLNAAAFVSIHINSVDNAPSASGTEVYYSSSNNGDAYGATSEQLANNILGEMISRMGTRNRGVKTAQHVVTRTSNMPAVLVEVGFITNEEELSKMINDEFQNKVAQGIAEGIMKTMGNIHVPN